MQACDSCRKRKRRCLWDEGAEKCAHCTQMKEECASTYVRKQRSRPQRRYVGSGYHLSQILMELHQKNGCAVLYKNRQCDQRSTLRSCSEMVLTDTRERVVEYERRIQNLENLLRERSEIQPHFQSQPLQPLPSHDPDDSMSLSMWVDNLRTEVEQYPIEASTDLDPTTYQGTYQMTGSASVSYTHLTLPTKRIV